MNEPVILVDSLVKRFGSRDILRGISFSVAKGETVVLLGRSGTGKSVTLKTLIGLMSPTSGTALIDGTSLSDLPERQRLRARQKIGYVFQGGALFDSLSILENVGFSLYQNRLPAATIRTRVHERLQMVGLAHTIDQYPSDLSGGMQKRVALARAIIDLPRIVFYDEPTSGLDPLTTDVINQIILRLRSNLGVSSIVVTHDIKSAFTIADRIVMLDQGKVVISGTPAEIMASDLPWVQHFIQGKALEGETIGTSMFQATSHITRSQALSGRRVAVGRSPPQSHETSELPVEDPGQSSRSSSNRQQVPPAVRGRRKRDDSDSRSRRRRP